MRNPNAKYYLPAIIWLVLIFIVSSIPNLSTPPLGFTFSDKIAHFTEYFILGAFGALAFYHSKVKYPFLTTLALSSVYGILDELHQYFVPGRSMDIYDILADILGSMAGIGAYLIVNRFWDRSKTNLGRGGVK